MKKKTDYDWFDLYFNVLKKKEKPMRKKKENPKILECGGKSFNISWLEVDNKPYLSYIAWEELEEKMGKRMYKNFGKFLSGQTSVFEGAYVCDVENFFRPKNKQFWD